MFSTARTDLKSKRGIWGLLLFVFFTILSAAWVAQSTPFGTNVTNGSISFKAPDAKAGENMAEILNKAEKKAERQEKKDDRKEKK